MNNDKLDKIYKLALHHRDKMVEWRREFHQFPELALKEFRTSRRVTEELERLGLHVDSGIGGTGVVGLLRGGKPGRTVALRADMDALPIMEENHVSYSSQNEGVMHACGHDGHTAILLGVATVLASIKDELCGNVKFIFQPAEEGGGGAQLLIQEDVLHAPEVEAIVALHLFPEFPSGAIAIRNGTITSAVSNIEMMVVGKSGHAARPQEGIDAIQISAEILMSIQALLARKTDSLNPKVVSICRISGGTTHNIIASEVIMLGTIRTLNRETGDQVIDLIKRKGEAIVRSWGGDFSLVVEDIAPPLINDDALNEIVRRAALECLGKDSVFAIPHPSLGGEDFAYYAEQIPATLFRLGTRNEDKGMIYPLHSSQFDFDDIVVLPRGAAVLAKTAMHMLTTV